MDLTVRLYASLAEAAGVREVTVVDLPQTVTVGDLGAAVFARFPALASLRESVIFAINAEYVRPDHPVRPGDEVALIPPVSGGSTPTPEIFFITPDSLDVPAIQELARTDASGAVSIFVGVVRNMNQGRDVNYLEYDAYPAMTIKLMRQIASEARARWAINELVIHHRVGRLEIGEASVVVAASAPHRGESIAACQYGIDRLKAIVPIWKKEVWTDGEHWVEGSLTPRDEAAPSPEPSTR
jgi:molybdopterin converting factor subunit 1